MRRQACYIILGSHTGRGTDLDDDLVRRERQRAERDRFLDLRVRARRRVGRHLDRDCTARMRQMVRVLAVDAEPRRLVGRDDQIRDDVTLECGPVG